MPRFSTVDEFLALTGDEAPTKAERALIEACREGRRCILGDATRPDAPSDERTIRATLLRLLITGGTPGCGLADDGVSVVGAWIDGSLILQYAKLRGRTILEACHFTDKPNLIQARLHLLSLRGSHLPGLLAQGMVVKGPVFLRTITATGTIDVAGAVISGELDCTGAVLDGKEGKALKAQGVTVGQNFVLSRLSATGTVDVAVARIGGQLACDGAKLDGRDGKALNAQGVTVGESLFLTGLAATGTVDVAGAEVGGQMACKGAVLDGKGGEALNAEGLLVKAGLHWWNVNVKQGGVSFSSARVGQLVDDMGSWPKGEDELDLDGFTYDRIGGAPTDATRRLDWLKTGAAFKGTLFPQPYTQLSKVLRQMGHHRDARLVLAEQSRLLGVEARRLRRLKPDGTHRLFFKNPFADFRHLLAYCFDWFLRSVAGYGHRPWFSAIWLLGLFLLATTLAQCTWTEGSFAPNSDVVLTSPDWQSLMAIDCIGPVLDSHTEPCIQNPADIWSAKSAPGMDWDTFNPIGYAADLVIPILNLGQTEAWAPSKDRGPMGKTLWWGRWVLEALGWLVTALGVAAITGIMQRNAPE